MGLPLWDSCPCKKRKTKSLSPPCEDSGRRQPSASQDESSFQESASIWILNFPTAKTVRNKCMFKPPGLQDFVVHPKLSKTIALNRSSIVCKSSKLDSSDVHQLVNG